VGGGTVFAGQWRPQEKKKNEDLAQKKKLNRGDVLLGDQRKTCVWGVKHLKKQKRGNAEIDEETFSKCAGKEREEAGLLEVLFQRGKGECKLDQPKKKRTDWATKTKTSVEVGALGERGRGGFGGRTKSSCFFQREKTWGAKEGKGGRSEEKTRKGRKKNRGVGEQGGEQAPKKSGGGNGKNG